MIFLLKDQPCAVSGLFYTVFHPSGDEYIFFVLNPHLNVNIRIFEVLVSEINLFLREHKLFKKIRKKYQPNLIVGSHNLSFLPSSLL